MSFMELCDLALTIPFRPSFPPSKGWVFVLLSGLCYL